MNSHFRLCFVAAAFGCLSLAFAAQSFSQNTDTSLLEPIDLSPGPDVPSPGSLALNRSTHKLYVGGHRFFMEGLKVIDTRTNVATGGLSFGTYLSGQPFLGYSIAVDESPGPDGNKLYVVGTVGAGYVVRVVDGETDTNLTGEGTDIILPLSPSGSYFFIRAVVNPTTHKVYVSPGDGQVIVIDGRTRTVLKTLNPNAGSFLAVDPVANKIFVLGANGGAIIDGTTDTVSAPPQPLNFVATAAAFNEADQRIYLVGPEGEVGFSGVYVLDGQSGLLVASRTGLQLTDPRGITLVPAESTVYVGGTAEILALGTSDLSQGGSFSQPNIDAYRTRWTGDLACDPAGSGMLFTLYGRSRPGTNPNAVIAIDRTSAELANIVTAYFPGRIAINPRTNAIYALDSQFPELVVVDGQTRSVVARVELPSAGGDLAVSERLNRVFFSNGVVLDGATNQLHTSMPTSPAVRFLAIDETRRRLYRSFVSAAFGSATWSLEIFDADAAALLNALSLGNGGPGGGALIVNPVNGRIYLSSQSGGGAFSFDRFFVIDGANSQLVTGTPAIGHAEGGMGVNRKTNDLYVPQPNGNIIVLDGTTDQINASFPASSNASGDPRFTGIAIDEQADTVTVTEITMNGQKAVGRFMTYKGQGDHALVDQREIGNPGAGLAFHPGTRQFFAPNLDDGTITVIQATGTAPRNQLGNLSTRLRVGGDDDVMISGFLVEGPSDSARKVIVRAVGPSMQALGVQGALSDTILELHTSDGSVITNDDWKINAASGESQLAEIEATGLAPSNDLEAAIVADLPPGAHTAVIRGKDGAVGVGLAEVFVLDLDSPAELANIATRGRVETGENVMIGGLIVSGSTASRVLVRAIGPSLAEQLTGALEDPVLELYDINGGLITANDDWRSPDEAEIAATTIPPTHDRESALTATLYPGNYTAIVRGKDETTGVALVEAYRLD